MTSSQDQIAQDLNLPGAPQEPVLGAGAPLEANPASSGLCMDRDAPMADAATLMDEPLR